MLYCRVLFNVFACSIGHGQMVNEQLNGINSTASAMIATSKPEFAHVSPAYYLGTPRTVELAVQTRF